MTTASTYPSRRQRRGRVIALHCSGSGASQWCHLAEVLGGDYALLAPEHYGCEATGHWTGEHAFTLADEAARIVALIDEGSGDGSGGKVHLVGHSYGGGVALEVALSRPGRIASMALYEPTAFHLLEQTGEAGTVALAEVAGVAGRMGRSVASGDYRGAVAAFVDYWNGPGAWDGLRPHVQSALIRWAPKGPMDFHALIEEATPADAYRALTFPVLIMRGEHAPTPTRLIAEALAELLPASRLAVVGGAGHMGPLTHAPVVLALIARHIATAEPQRPRLGKEAAPDARRAVSRPAGAVSCPPAWSTSDDRRRNENDAR
jgi:pimeloyl-ACP methyl ester carboxylesterase